MNILNVLRRKRNATNMLMRDITGQCEGECRDRVREGEHQRQTDINRSSVEEVESYPEVQWAQTRNDPPGALGGHV